VVFTIIVAISYSFHQVCQQMVLCRGIYNTQIDYDDKAKHLGVCQEFEIMQLGRVTITHVDLEIFNVAHHLHQKESTRQGGVDPVHRSERSLDERWQQGCPRQEQHDNKCQPVPAY
jgi:hypothetical protein